MTRSLNNNQVNKSNHQQLLKLIKNNYIDPNTLDPAILNRIFKERDQEGLRILLQDPNLILVNTKITMGHNFNKYNRRYPEGTTHLIFPMGFTQDIKEAIPDSVTHLELYGNLNIFKDIIPNSITHLSLYNIFSNIEGVIPNNVTHLKLHGHYNDIKKIIPNSVTHLTINGSYHDIVEIIPDNVTHLKLRGTFNNIQEAIPKSIIYLSLRGLFNGIGKFSRSNIDIELHSEEILNNKVINLKLRDTKDLEKNSFKIITDPELNGRTLTTKDLEKNSFKIINNHKPQRQSYLYQNTFFYEDAITCVKKMDKFLLIKLSCGESIVIDKNSDHGIYMTLKYFN